MHFFPAVRGFGIIGGGAVLFTASALAGQTILPMLGETGKHLSIRNVRNIATVLELLKDLIKQKCLARHWNSCFSVRRGSGCVKSDLYGTLLQVMVVIIMMMMMMMMAPFCR